MQIIPLIDFSKVDKFLEFALQVKSIPICEHDTFKLKIIYSNVESNTRH